MVYTAKQLVFAATARCQCGAGLAYPKAETRPRGYLRVEDQQEWDCSDILLGLAPAKGQPGTVFHDEAKPFIFWEIKSELQPSANGATTRYRKDEMEDEL